MWFPGAGRPVPDTTASPTDGKSWDGSTRASRRCGNACPLRTAPLKFDHPGLGTTATEHNGLLLIQNDIGTTDFHVLVVRVDGLTATVTYTDIHNARLRFFKSLFEGFDVAWEGGGRRGRKLSSGEYLLATGVHTARDDRGLDGFLAHLGSRIVFLIDWNRMRKRLRAFVSKRRAIDALKWAAANDYGNRGLIEIDGEQALAEAVETEVVEEGETLSVDGHKGAIYRRNLKSTETARSNSYPGSGIGARPHGRRSARPGGRAIPSEKKRAGVQRRPPFSPKRNGATSVPCASPWRRSSGRRRNTGSDRP
jgi:hypothetical protein